MQPGSKVLYLGAASGTTVSHVADLVGPVIKINYLYFHRKVQYMQLNFQREVEETWLTWLRKELTLFQSLKTPDIPKNTECLYQWLT